MLLRSDERSGPSQPGAQQSLRERREVIAVSAADTCRTCQCDLNFDEALMLSATRTYCWREIGWTFVLVLLGIARYAGFLFARGDRSWTLGVACAVVVFGVGLCAAMYRTHAKRAREFLHRLA